MTKIRHHSINANKPYANMRFSNVDKEIYIYIYIYIYISNVDI